jgi:hypothetical protein
VSPQSQAIFAQALTGWQPDDDPAELHAAAVGHLGASRRLVVIAEEYDEALAAGEHQRAQELADELVPVRQAERVAAGVLPAKAGD